MTLLGQELQWFRTTEFDYQSKSMQEHENTAELGTDLANLAVRVKTAAQKLVLVVINV